MHRFHPLANPPAHLPLRTRDVDLAFAADAALPGNLRTALGGAGFAEELFGDESPPATHYRLGEEDAGFYAEFLTPLHGSGVKRGGASDATVSKAGVTAQKLRYLELLLLAPWSILAVAPYDLFLRGGRLVDPRHGIDGMMDLAVAERTIAAVAENRGVLNGGEPKELLLEVYE